jgi:Flp pilus assembly protein TadG
MNLERLIKLCRRPSWQAGQSETTLRPTREKLEKPCWLFRRNRRAAAAVEFAVVAPVFFLMIFGMIEYGRMVMVQQVITNASREGARLAVLDGASFGEIEDRVNDYLEAASIDTGSTNVEVLPDPPTSAAFGEPITVTVEVPFSEVSWLPSPMYLGGKTLTATTVMRRESVQ